MRADRFHQLNKIAILHLTAKASEHFTVYEKTELENIDSVIKI